MTTWSPTTLPPIPMRMIQNQTSLMLFNRHFATQIQTPNAVTPLKRKTIWTKSTTTWRNSMKTITNAMRYALIKIQATLRSGIFNMIKCMTWFSSLSREFNKLADSIKTLISYRTKGCQMRVSKSPGRTLRKCLRNEASLMKSEMLLIHSLNT